MSLRLKFNLVLLLCFMLALTATAVVTRTLLGQHAQKTVVGHAQLMMEAALAVRSYTVEQITPNLEMQMMRDFLPQSVPAYAAAETFLNLHRQYPDFSYKEAALNPTSPRNRATDWESDLIHHFRNNPSSKELVGEHDGPTGQQLYIARPIQIKKDSCLRCHSTPDAAPAGLIKRYGTANGFGWQKNEIIGAQIVMVPMGVPLAQAKQAFTTFMLLLCGVFLGLFVVLNVLLSLVIVRPLTRMAAAADAISTGDFSVATFAEKGHDELARLGASFNRMRRSLEKAMSLIDE